MITGARIARNAATSKAQLEAQMVDFSQMQTSVTGLLQAQNDALSSEVDDLSAAGYPIQELQTLVQNYNQALTILSNALQIQYDALQGFINLMPSA